ncbi:MAG TPA: glycosyl hydrolase 53 family protein, partial [Ferruginibacter sp.]|nr:glycosyl hydrolase 53 family protein [Ferruginibacter sp.]
MKTSLSTTLLILLFLVSACQKSGSGSAEPPVLIPTIAKGADVSWVTQMESSGIKFYNSSGTQVECMQLLQS